MLIANQSTVKTVRPEYVVTEEYRQIQDHVHCGGGGRSERCGKLELAVGGFDQGAARQDKQERRQEGNSEHAENVAPKSTVDSQPVPET